MLTEFVIVISALCMATLTVKWQHQWFAPVSRQKLVVCPQLPVSGRFVICLPQKSKSLLAYLKEEAVSVPGQVEGRADDS